MPPNFFTQTHSVSLLFFRISFKRSKPQIDLSSNLSDDLGSDSGYVFLSDLEDLFDSEHQNKKSNEISPPDLFLANNDFPRAGSLPLRLKNLGIPSILNTFPKSNRCFSGSGKKAEIKSIFDSNSNDNIPVSSLNPSNVPPIPAPVSHNTGKTLIPKADVDQPISDFQNTLPQDTLIFRRSRTSCSPNRNSFDGIKAELSLLSKNDSHSNSNNINEYPFLSTDVDPMYSKIDTKKIHHKNEISTPTKLSFKPETLNPPNKLSSNSKKDHTLSSHRSIKKKRFPKSFRSGTISAEEASKLVQRRIDFLYNHPPPSDPSSNSFKIPPLPLGISNLPPDDTLYSNADLNNLTISLIFIVDVRSSIEYDKSHIVGAISMHLLKSKSTAKRSFSQILDDYLNELTLSQFPNTTKHRHIVLFYDDGISGSAWNHTTLYKELQVPHTLLSLDCGYQAFFEKYPYLCTSFDLKFPQFSLLNNLIKNNADDSFSKQKFSNLISELAISESNSVKSLNERSFRQLDLTISMKTLKIQNYDPPKWLVDRAEENVSNPGIASGFFSKIETSENIRLQEMNDNQNKNVIMDYSFESGKNRINQNRYPNILPYDHSRVILQSKFTGNDYINASFVGLPGGPQYIVTQGPMESTINDFWQMVWEQNIGVIVMLGNLVELGREKCFQYWPKSFGVWKRFKLRPKTELGEAIISVRMEAAANDCNFDGIIVRLFRARLSINGRLVGKARMITHIQYTDWADNKVPTDVQVFLRVVKLVNCATGFTSLNTFDSQHIVVHCSAGCGRSGVFCTIDTALRLKKGDNPVIVEDYDPLFSIVSAMRRQRMGMVQNLEQFLFCYKALYSSFKKVELKYPQLDVVSVPVEQLKLVIRWNRLKSKVFSPDSAHMVWIMVALMEISNELSEFQKQFNHKRTLNQSNTSLTEFERPFSTEGFISKLPYSLSDSSDSLETPDYSPRKNFQSDCQKFFRTNAFEKNFGKSDENILSKDSHILDIFNSRNLKITPKLSSFKRSNSLNIPVTSYKYALTSFRFLKNVSSNGETPLSDIWPAIDENKISALHASNSKSSNITTYNSGTKRSVKKVSPASSKSSSHKILLIDLLSQYPPIDKKAVDKNSPFYLKKPSSGSKKNKKAPNLVLNLDSSLMEKSRTKGFMPFLSPQPETPNVESFSSSLDPMFFRNKNKFNLKIPSSEKNDSNSYPVPPRPKNSISKLIPTVDYLVSSATSVDMPKNSNKILETYNPSGPLSSSPSNQSGLNSNSKYHSKNSLHSPTQNGKDFTNPILKTFDSRSSPGFNSKTPYLGTPKEFLLSPGIQSEILDSTIPESRNANNSNSTLYSSSKALFSSATQNSSNHTKLETRNSIPIKSSSVSHSKSFRMSISRTREHEIMKTGTKNMGLRIDPPEFSYENAGNFQIFSNTPFSAPISEGFPSINNQDDLSNDRYGPRLDIEDSDFLVLSEIEPENHQIETQFSEMDFISGLVRFPRLKPSFE
ncbi:Tyrosine-protein phosphatase non-receptor type 22 [Smittium mucronatum]|uniref:protein-tyrosine-phosphatase n=1 Tax=Smittium mucronatum TaxID=133383 RepID=A0A1R0GXJ9_9FUNG|nr:Tyrosine-protein phosphatase non-receptor type 22 [Smittium mucronatum]